MARTIDQKKKITTDACFNKVPTRGRPKLVINALGKEIIESLAQCFCTEEEIAAVLDVDLDTLKSKANKETFSECIKKGQEYGKASLRRWQYEKAKNGSTTMLIWLGKQLLGQKDKLDVAGDAEQLKHLDEILGHMKERATAADDLEGGSDGDVQ